MADITRIHLAFIPGCEGNGPILHKALLGFRCLLRGWLQAAEIAQLLKACAAYSEDPGFVPNAPIRWLTAVCDSSSRAAGSSSFSGHQHSRGVVHTWHTPTRIIKNKINLRKMLFGCP